MSVSTRKPMKNGSVACRKRCKIFNAKIQRPRTSRLSRDRGRSQRKAARKKRGLVENRRRHRRRLVGVVIQVLSFHRLVKRAESVTCSPRGATRTRFETKMLFARAALARAYRVNKRASIPLKGLRILTRLDPEFLRWTATSRLRCISLPREREPDEPFPKTVNVNNINSLAMVWSLITTY